MASNPSTSYHVEAHEIGLAYNLTPNVGENQIIPSQEINEYVDDEIPRPKKICLSRPKKQPRIESALSLNLDMNRPSPNTEVLWDWTNTTNIVQS